MFEKLVWRKVLVISSIGRAYVYRLAITDM